MDLHTGRPPVFTTEEDLGTFRHDNKVVIRIDVSDFDPLQANLEYSITAGALPTGLSIELNVWRDIRNTTHPDRNRTGSHDHL